MFGPCIYFPTPTVGPDPSALPINTRTIGRRSQTLASPLQFTTSLSSLFTSFIQPPNDLSIMRSTFIVAALAAVAAAQSSTGTASAAANTGSISTCVITCSTTAAQSAGCSSYADLSCVCTSQDFQSAARSCLESTCPDEVASATALQTSLCQGYTNTTNSIGQSASSVIASITSSVRGAASSALASASSAANSSVAHLSQSVVSTASAASVSATATHNAAQAVVAVPGSMMAVAATVLGFVVGPMVLFA